MNNLREQISEKLPIYLLPIVSVMLMGLGLLGGIPGVLGVFSLELVVVIWFLKPRLISPLLILVGMLFIRPNIWGESYSNVGMGIFLFAALIAIVQDRGKIHFANTELKPLHSPLFWVTIAYLWLLFRSSFQGLSTVGQSLSGYTSVAVCLCSVLVVLGDGYRRKVLAAGFVIAVVIVSFSYVMSLIVWVLAGFGAGALGSIRVGSWPAPQPVYFPFTTTVATQAVFGHSIPRFVGFSREPGWMAMYACVAYFIYPLVGFRRRLVRGVILLALLGTISTAGFGVFVVCLAIRFALGMRSARSSYTAVLRFAVGALFLGIALWAALYAPVLGFDSKGEQNGISLSERSAATNMGIWAFEHNPFGGGLAADKVGAVNLVAAVAAYGIPFSIAMGVATLAPVFRSTNRRLVIPVLAPLFLTLLMSQPALDSSWVYALAMIGASATLDTHLPLGARILPQPLRENFFDLKTVTMRH